MPRTLSVARLRLLWGSLLSTLWFLPGLMLLAGAALAIGMVELSTRVDGEVLARWPRLFGASADSSRDMLATIAGSLITVAGVTFSITVVAVTQASAQYSPRILRNFMRDRSSQAVLGGLAAIFIYCLVVLRTIRGDNGSFVPAIAVLFGFVLAALGIALLIFFIHHIASAMQASSIIERVATDTLMAVDRLFPADVGDRPTPDGAAAPSPEGEPIEWLAVPALRAGYVQHVDGDTLIGVARRFATVVRMERGVGDFVVPGRPLASVARGGRVPRTGPHPGAHAEGPGGSAADAWQQLSQTLRDAFDLGSHRTVEQDAAFGVRQLVDVAVKALSPGINDPTTALNAIDFLGVVLARAAVRVEEPAHRVEDDALRVIARGPTFATLAEGGLGEIRRYAEGQAAVLGRLAEIIEAIGALTTDANRHRVLLAQLDLLAETVERSIASRGDREELEARLRAVHQGLTRGSTARPSHAREAQP